MERKIRMGFIGVGSMGFSHLELFHRDCDRDCQAVAICATNKSDIARARDVAPEVVLYKNKTDLIRSDLDAVIVSTPNLTHVPLALEALEAGKHVFLEKPVGIKPAECRKLLRATQKSDRTLMIGHELRYSPYFAKMKKLVNADAVGEPKMVWCKEFRGPLMPKSRNWIQDRRRSGGCLVDKNCHHFDLMNWWAGARPRRVAAFGGNAVNRVIEGPNQVHDHVAVSWEYDNTVRGTLHLCLFAHDPPKETLEMGIVGDKGVLQTNLEKLEILHWQRSKRRGEPRIHKVKAKRGIGWGGHLGFAEMHPAFVKSIRTGQTPLTSVANCMDGTLLAIAGEESIRTGKISTIR